MLIESYANASSILDVSIVSDSKKWQTPKPYLGLGVAFSNVGLGSGLDNEAMTNQFFNGISQFQNLSIFIGMRLNGYFGAEVEYTKLAKTLYETNSNIHLFNSDIIFFRAMFYPLTIDFGSIGSLELFLNLGTAVFATMQSTRYYGGQQTSDNMNNTFNITYGGGIQFGFPKYVALRLCVDAISPTNGMNFGPNPYGNVMVVYNLGLAFYPF